MGAEGLSRCGADGCDGVVTAAGDAWKKAQESQQEIISAMEEVEKLSKMVSPTAPRHGLEKLDTSVPLRQRRTACGPPEPVLLDR